MIAIDWGTSSLRAYLLHENGQVLQRRRSDQGILACNGRFAEVLQALITDWHGPVLLSGMIGSRNGWIELPYLPAPVGAAELSAAMRLHHDPGLPGHALWFVPGVACHAANGVPDVMRGEETQLVGLLTELPPGAHVACLPGTHSKWARLEDARIADFATVMTGELYALLRQHSLLGRLMTDPPGHFDNDAFTQGVVRSGEPGGLPHHLFGTRTLALFDRLPGDGLASYLSGLLIGHEIREHAPHGASVHLVGNPGLSRRYAQALELVGLGSIRHREDLAATGLHLLARLRGL